MKKRNITKALLLIMAVMMVLMTGCGSSAKEDDPNLGVYVAKSADMSGFNIGLEDLYEEVLQSFILTGLLVRRSLWV